MALTSSTHAVTHVKIHASRTTSRPLERPVAPGNDFENLAPSKNDYTGLWAVAAWVRQLKADARADRRAARRVRAE